MDICFREKKWGYLYRLNILYNVYGVEVFLRFIYVFLLGFYVDFFFYLYDVLWYDVIYYDMVWYNDKGLLEMLIWLKI